MGHPRPLPVAFPVHSGFDMIFAHILEDVMRKVSDRKRIMISADNAFQRTGLTGLRIPGIECAARIGQRQKITLPAFFIIPRLRAGDFGNAGEIKQSGVKLHLFPAQPHILAANGKQVKVLFQRAVFNGMNGVEIFTKQLQVAEIVFQQLPALANFIGPCRLRRRGMGAGKHAVAVKAVIFAIEFFCVHQLRDGL